MVVVQCTYPNKDVAIAKIEAVTFKNDPQDDSVIEIFLAYRGIKFDSSVGRFSVEIAEKIKKDLADHMNHIYNMTLWNQAGNGTSNIDLIFEIPFGDRNENGAVACETEGEVESV